MKTPLILSVAAAAVLSLSLHADESSDRMEAMEAQIKALQTQLDTLKGSQAKAARQPKKHQTRRTTKPPTKATKKHQPTMKKAMRKRETTPPNA